MLFRLLPGLRGPALLLGLLAGAACQRHTVPAASTAADCIDPARVNPTGICPMLYDPVCGCDGKTYSNACVAERAGVRSYQKGACASSK